MRSKIVFLCSFLILISSCKEQEARRPVTASKTYTLASTAEQLKEINAIQEAKVQDYMTKDSLVNYISSSYGYWYQYIQKVDQEAKTPQKEDIVEISYEILDLNDRVIYSKEELGIKEYKIDKEDFIPALQQGIKMMKIGETVKFVIPSFNAFGVVGDDHKIGINQSIISIVTLINIKENPQNEE
ncbi:gliding motility-associated peptidyl-prolyl isomerase GldI [Pseudotenacibaculum sp. MALMAid0570]|uniref:gliding motility-associated peptidyl-prolyl isomerase GldI n=1 Tax=Pseudotenacibaculum sp. MALMAid0570 TaxID=3143938 RepID=UPI0032DE9DF2